MSARTCTQNLVIMVMASAVCAAAMGSDATAPEDIATAGLHRDKTGTDKGRVQGDATQTKPPAGFAAGGGLHTESTRQGSNGAARLLASLRAFFEANPAWE